MVIQRLGEELARAWGRMATTEVPEARMATRAAGCAEDRAPLHREIRATVPIRGALSTVAEAVVPEARGQALPEAPL